MNDRENRDLAKYERSEIDVRNKSRLPAHPSEYDYDYEYEEDELNLREYLDIVIRRKWLIIACVVIAVVSVGIKSLTETPLYRATASLEISPVTPKIVMFQDVVEMGSPTWNTEQYYETQFRLLKSASFGTNVISKLGLDKNLIVENEQSNKSSEGFFSSIIGRIFPDKNKGKENIKENKVELNELQAEKKNSLARSFLAGLVIRPVPKTSIVNLQYISPNPEFAKKAVNTIVDEYINWLLERKHSASKSARKFLQKQLGQTKANLEKAEETLNSFAKSVNIVSLDGTLNLEYTQLSKLNEALSETENERLAKEAVYEEIKSGNFEYLPNIVNDESMVEVRTEYTALKSKLDNLSVIYGPNYPEIKQLKAQLARVETEMGERAENVANSIKSEYKATLRKEKLIRERTDEQNKRVAALNDKAIQYKILAREVDTNKSIFESLLQRLKETEITSASEATNVQVLDYSTKPRFPFSPNYKNNISYAAMVGLMIGVLIAFVLNFFDNTIKDDEELKTKFRVPFLGSIPLAKDLEEGFKIEISVHEQPNSLISEAFRVIRTSLLYSSPENPPKSILISSTQPLEGKTTTSVNLALSLSQSGQRVVLVDSDLRKPRIHKLLSKNGNTHGLSSYLVGESDYTEIVAESNLDGLKIVTSGPIPPNPAELVGSRKMRELIERLEDEFDIIILDGSPIGGFADSRLLSRLVDGVVIVTSIGITQKPMLKNSIEEIRKVRGRIIGTVVNRLETTRGKYGYNYYYYYSEDSKAKEDTPRISSPNA